MYVYVRTYAYVAGSIPSAHSDNNSELCTRLKTNILLKLLKRDQIVCPCVDCYFWCLRRKST